METGRWLPIYFRTYEITVLFGYLRLMQVGYGVVVGQRLRGRCAEQKDTPEKVCSSFWCRLFKY